MNNEEGDLRRLFEQSLDMLCIAGFDGYYKKVNPEWPRTLGYTSAELLSRPYVEFIHPDDVAGTLEEAQKLTQGVDTIWFENRYRCKNGAYRHLQWRARPDMKRKLIFAAARDMTGYKIMERELRVSGSMQRAILQGASHAIISCRPNGIIQAFNAGAQKLLGYTPEEVVGKITPLIFHDPQEVASRAQSLAAELGKPVEASFEAFVAGAREGGTDEREWTYIRKDGRRISVMLSVCALRDEQEQITGYLGIASDITAHRHAERGKLESEARLKAILDNTAAVVFLKDKEGRYQLVNHHFEELFHIRQEDILGKDDYAVFPPEFAQAFRENDAKVIASGLPMTLEETAPGSEAPHTYVSVKFPVCDAEGRAIALGGIATDITDRKRAEVATQDREARLSAILETAVEGIMTMDDKGVILTANPAALRIFDLSGEELLGSSIHTIIPGPHFLTRSTAAAEKRPPTGSREVVGRRKDGSLVPLIMSVNETVTEERRLFTAIVHDITSRKMMEEELRRSNEELEQFAHIASHDLQEPLRVITSCLLLLERRCETELSGESSKLIQTARDGADRMRHLIQDLLAYSSVSMPAQTRAPVDCEKLLRDVLAGLSVAIEEARAIVTHDPLPTVRVDATQISQVFQNLISNALKYRGPRACRVHVSAQPSNGEWMFSVRDDGIGIDSSFFERIFVIFQKLHPREEYSGTGIGLALCKRIVERHGGQIWVDSAPGRGATFFFTLPDRH